MWGLMVFFSFFQFLMQVSGNLMAEAWRTSFTLNSVEIGILSSSFFYGYILVQIPAGFLLDTVGMKQVVRWALTFFVLGLIAFAMSPSFPLAMFARFITGLGAGFAFVGMVYAAASWFRSSIFVIFVGLGEMLSMLLTAVGQTISPTLLLHFGWRLLMFGYAGVGFVLWALVMCFLKNPPEFKRSDLHLYHIFKTHWRAVVQVPSVWLAGLFCCGMFSVITVFASLWGNSYLQARYHLSYPAASHLIALIPLGFAIGSPIIGFLNERLIPVRYFVVGVGMLLTFSSLSVMLFGASLPILMISLVCLGLFGSGNVLAFYIAERSVAPHIRGIAIGFCNAIAISGGMIFQPLIGFLLEHSNIAIAMWVFPALIFFAGLNLDDPYGIIHMFCILGTFEPFELG
jgi:MFS family permease